MPQVLDLLPFLGKGAGNGSRLQLTIAAQPEVLALDYIVQIPLVEDFPVWPPLTVETGGAPVEGLWTTTCLECFIAFDGGYREFNFSPSGAWGMLDFLAYRQPQAGMTWGPSLGYPFIEAGAAEIAGRYELKVSLPASLLPTSPHRVGVTAVIQRQSDQALSYWALAHAADKPDFHHPDSFILPWSVLMAG